MKRIFCIVSLILGCLVLTGCETTGLDWDSAPDLITPTVDAETSVRTWNNGKPTQTTVPNDPAFQ